MLAIGLAIGSNFLYGMSDFLGGLKSRSLPLLSVLLVSQAGALVALTTILVASQEGPPDGRFVLYAALAGLSEAIGVAALYRGLAVGQMTIVAPVAATAPAIPVVAAIFLQELPTPGQGAGIVSRGRRCRDHLLPPSGTAVYAPCRPQRAVRTVDRGRVRRLSWW
jgi:uncharacterized membrane protein